MYNNLIELINQYEHIALYRHVNPDFDAFGSQIGLYMVLKENFKHKHFYLLGNTEGYAYNLFTNCYDGNVPDFNTNKVLGIVLDTANQDRIDDISYKQCDALIKIDHHIIVEDYGQLNIVDELASSCSEIIGEFLLLNPYLTIPVDAANAIYSGIIGDSNRFLYDHTNSKTFKVASFLVEKGACIKEIYSKMYQRDSIDLKIQGHILSNFKLNDKIAYYILEEEDLTVLGIDREKGANFVNLFSGIKEIEIWMAITKNTIENNYRVRIRSKNIPINEVASNYNGGGHALASGATIQCLDELEQLLEDLKEKLNG